MQPLREGRSFEGPSRPVRIACLEQYSGRNVGDSISLVCLMDRIYGRIPGVVFDVYSYRGGHRKLPPQPAPVRFVDLMPWRGTINYLGLPSLLHLPEADWVLTRGGRFFSNRLWNPYYNHMLNFRVLFPWLKRRGKPILLWDIGIGPLKTARSIEFAKVTLGAADMITTRDDESDAWLDRLGVEPQFRARSADPVWLMPPPAIDAASIETCARLGVRQSRPYSVVNVTSLIGSFPKGPVSLEALTAALGDAIGRLETAGDVWLMPTQISDVKLCHQLAEGSSSVRVFPTHDVSSAVLHAFLGGARLSVGMRYHAVILSIASGTPTVGIGYAPKVVDLFRFMQAEDWCVSGDELPTLGERVMATLADSREVSDRQRSAVARLKDRAAAADECFARFVAAQGS